MSCGGSHLGFPIGIKNRNLVEDLPMIPDLVQALQSKVEGLNHSLSWVGTGTSIKSGGAKPLTFLAWYRHFNQKWRG